MNFPYTHRAHELTKFKKITHILSILLHLNLSNELVKRQFLTDVNSLDFFVKFVSSCAHGMPMCTGYVPKIQKYTYNDLKIPHNTIQSCKIV
jgi:hypothetical protein